MSKTITIPDDRGSRVYVTINGRDYVYTAGETVTVPDEVAALFENNEYQDVVQGRPVVAPTDAAMHEIRVEGHKLIIPDTWE